MRTSRQKITWTGTYYHLMNRIAGPKEGHHPFTRSDKEHGFGLIREACRYFLVEVISAAWMGNHFHIVVYAPSELPGPEAVAARYNAFFGERREPLDPSDAALCRKIGREMIDISSFMKWYQQKFSSWYNHVRDRRGGLWADRFRSTILEGENALWSAVKYVELNPVRAGLASDPGDYRFTSWGRFCGTGTHPFETNFVRHLRRSRFGSESRMGAKDVLRLFDEELARTVAGEKGQAGKALDRAAEVSKPDGMRVRFLRRTRHFTDGAIIGSATFVLETAARLRGVKKLSHRLCGGTSPSGENLFCFRRLRTEE